MPSTRRAPSDPLKEKIRPRRARPTPETLLTAGVGLDELMRIGERQFEQWRANAQVDVIVQAMQKLPLLMARYGIAAATDGKFGRDAWMHLAEEAERQLAREDDFGHGLAVSLSQDAAELLVRVFVRVKNLTIKEKRPTLEQMMDAIDTAGCSSVLLTGCVEVSTTPASQIRDG